MGHAQRHVAAIERLSRDDCGIEQQGLRGNHRLGLGYAIATMANAVPHEIAGDPSHVRMGQEQALHGGEVIGRWHEIIVEEHDHVGFTLEQIERAIALAAQAALRQGQLRLHRAVGQAGKIGVCSAHRDDAVWLARLPGEQVDGLARKAGAADGGNGNMDRSMPCVVP
ncbi:hypothetical protein ACFS32_10630 [Novosphingobium pokkalii]|uniref:hypothetical protein n=1 Tax=Novosphingobium pokkalii TaxID=1770194 RepID=UPI003632593E